jgi:hypothetical protein
VRRGPACTRSLVSDRLWCRLPLLARSSSRRRIRFPSEATVREPGSGAVSTRSFGGPRAARRGCGAASAGTEPRVLPLAMPPMSESPFATAAARQVSTRIEPYRGMAGVHLGMTEAEAKKAVRVPVERFNGDLVYGNLTIRLTETDPARVWAVIAYWPGPDDATRPKPIDQDLQAPHRQAARGHRRPHRQGRPAARRRRRRERHRHPAQLARRRQADPQARHPGPRGQRRPQPPDAVAVATARRARARGRPRAV